MTEFTLVLLRLVLWLLPGVLAFWAVRTWTGGRSRVGLGLLIGGLVAALLVKPFPLGLVILGLGALAALPLARRLPRG